jgi:S1-C subfamily serine protease
MDHNQSHLLQWVQGTDSETQPCGMKPSQSQHSDFLDAYSQAVTAVVQAVGSAVVSITIGKDGALSSAFEAAGAGSGVIIAPDGYVLTNSHVVSGQKNIMITLTEGTHSRPTLSEMIRRRTWRW